MFIHEKFEAYQLSVKFTELALRLAERIPSSHTALKDQLKRASISIQLNIAEGTGKTGQADRKRFYSIARGSALECAAICDIVNLIDKDLLKLTVEGKTFLKSIASILSIVCTK